MRFARSAVTVAVCLHRIDNLLSLWPEVYRLWESRPGHCLLVTHSTARDHAELMVRLANRLRATFAEVRFFWPLVVYTCAWQELTQASGLWQDYLPSGAPVRLLISICSGPLATGVIGGSNLQFQCASELATLSSCFVCVNISCGAGLCRVVLPKGP